MTSAITEAHRKQRRDDIARTALSCAAKKACTAAKDVRYVKALNRSGSVIAKLDAALVALSYAEGLLSEVRNSIGNLL